MILKPEYDRVDAKAELKVDECLPPGNNRSYQMNIVIGEQAFVPVSLASIRNKLEKSSKHKFL